MPKTPFKRARRFWVLLSPNLAKGRSQALVNREWEKEKLMREIVIVETRKQLDELYNCSAITWEGLRAEDFQQALEECGKDDAKGYLTTGKVMNELCNLTGNNRYPDDLNIFSIDKFKVLAIFVGARWMDDIMDNNQRREDKKNEVR